MEASAASDGGSNASRRPPVGTRWSLTSRRSRAVSATLSTERRWLKRGHTNRIRDQDRTGILVLPAKIDANADGGLTKEQGEAAFEALATELGELQELMYAAQSHAVLAVMRAWKYIG